MEIWCLLQTTYFSSEDLSGDIDILSAWETQELVRIEKSRLTLLGEKRIQIQKCFLNLNLGELK